MRRPLGRGSSKAIKTPASNQSQDRNRSSGGLHLQEYSLNVAGSLWVPAQLAGATLNGESNFIRLRNRSGQTLTNIILDYCNFYTLIGGDVTTSLDTLKLNAAVAYPTVTDVVRAATDYMLAPGEYKSFEVLVNIPKDGTFYVCTDIAITNVGGRYASAYLGAGTISTADRSRESYIEPTPASTKAAAGIALTGPTSTTIFTPVAVRSKCYNRFSFGAMGDSWIVGAGDGGTSADVSIGFAGRATSGTGLGTVDGYPYVQHGFTGAKATDLDNADALKYRLMIAEKALSHILIEPGVNDVVAAGLTLAGIKAALLSIAAQYVAVGVRPIACTIGPRTGSTDSWATVANQTKSSAYIAGSDAVAGADSIITQELNDWIRTTPAPFFDYFDAADVVMSARNSVIWTVNTAWTNDAYTNDGVHPNRTSNSPEEGAVYPLRDALRTKLTAWRASA